MLADPDATIDALTQEEFDRTDERMPYFAMVWASAEVLVARVLAGLGNNLNQLARRANAAARAGEVGAYASAVEVAGLRAELAGLRAAVEGRGGAVSG